MNDCAKVQASLDSFGKKLDEYAASEKVPARKEIAKGFLDQRNAFLDTRNGIVECLKQRDARKAGAVAEALAKRRKGFPPDADIFKLWADGPAEIARRLKTLEATFEKRQKGELSFQRVKWDRLCFVIGGFAGKAANAEERATLTLLAAARGDDVTPAVAGGLTFPPQTLSFLALLGLEAPQIERRKQR